MKGRDFKIKVVETFAALITSAFGLVAALAWNETIKAAVAQVFDTGNDIWGYLIYAILVTFLAIIMTLVIAWQADKLKGEDKSE